jgi:hypothetical protein
MTTTTTPVSVRPAPPRRRLTLPVAILVATVATAAIAVGVVVGRGGDGGAITGSGVGATVTRAVPPFTAVELAGSNVVTVRVGSPRRVVVHADDNLVKRVITEVHGGTLVITSRGSIRTRSPMSVEVTTPSLNGVGISGSGSIHATGVQADAFSAVLRGSGTIAAAGRAGQVHAVVTGAGELDLVDLLARGATATITGAGKITVYATDSLDATVTGTGVILYGGHPAEVTTHVSGTGSVSAL